MKRKKSITIRILTMVLTALTLISLSITIVGAIMIYTVTEDGIKNEVKYAAHSLYNIYDIDYSGEYSMDRNILFKGNSILTESDFKSKIDIVSCESDVDYTIFWGDTRIFTSVKNEDGSFAVGTSADPDVVKTVMGKGKEYYYRKIDVNRQKYAGYYIPLKNSGGEAVGMVFAGKPLDRAMNNSNKTIRYFVLISTGILVVSLIMFGRFLGKLVTALMDVHKYMRNVSQCRFDESLNESTLQREDEVGDIARSAETMKDNLRDLIECDPLTSLLNRRSCQKIIEGIVEEGKCYIAAMADIDFFKKVNDKYGHACGDMILQEISSIILEQTSSVGASVSRWGGEEFLIVIPHIEKAEAKLLLERIMEKIRSAIFVWKNNSLSVTITIGAVESIEGESADNTISRADDMLYEGKRSGRNCIVI